MKSERNQLFENINKLATNVTFTSSEGGPTIFAQVKNGKGVDGIVDLILSSWRASGASGPSL